MAMFSKSFGHPLMENNISKNNIKDLIKFLKTYPILTQNKKVREFENKWSKWLGVKYSVFVNSGSSANFITINNLKLLTKKKEIILPSLTWSSDVVSVIKNGFRPVFVDINFANLSLNIDKVIKKINKNTAAVFITHAQGFNGLNNKLINTLKKKKIYLIEDVCESHGAKFKRKKLGTLGFASNFSFYYAHHMSTIEGGMICTNDEDFYELCRITRSHGMLREASNSKYKKKIEQNNRHLNKQFIFLKEGFNMRNTELGAVLGLSQIKNLNSNILKRNLNLRLFLKLLNKEKYFVEFDMQGISNYALPIVLRVPSFELRNNLEKLMQLNKIEFRRGNAGGGNQLMQPYLKNLTKKLNIIKEFKVTNHIHDFGYYIGNFPTLKKSKIIKICKILNSINE
tara:strand:- start:3108 stop:4301 length:1194 start_codon:yes stop_codon:yes gene_type:complete